VNSVVPLTMFDSSRFNHFMGKIFVELALAFQERMLKTSFCSVLNSYPRRS